MSMTLDITDRVELFNQNIERLIKEKIADESSKTVNIVCTIGIDVSYKTMLSLIDQFCDETKNIENDIGPVYVISGSNGMEDIVGFVFYGADNIKMFFGAIGGESTKKPYPLETINIVFKAHLWCVGKIEFNNEGQDGQTSAIKEHEDKFFSSLLRAFLVSCQK